MSYQRFVFDSYHFDPQKRQITLRYSFDDSLHFAETITLPQDVPLNHTNSPDFDRALFALHLAGGASYYKAFCPPQIQVKSGQLNAEQADFWSQFYTNGLGEFFYKNKIDFRGLVNFPYSADAPHALKGDQLTSPKHALVPFGGGKDSQVTVQILRRHNADITLFRMQDHHFITELAHLNNLPLVSVQRQLDPLLFDLNKQGALNGHVPVTGFVTFLTIATAILLGHDSVFFSNERSSDYGNVEYLGMQVNHQWSKSNQAEQMMRSYIERFVTRKVQYLNLLRPLSELQIMQLFVREPTYFYHVTSCNRNWLWQKLDQDTHQKRWCGKCEKCAFTFALFAAFLPLHKVEDIFGKNLFNDNNLLSHYRQLWGAEAFKPFECVGTPQEVQAALYLATRGADYADTVIGHDFIINMLPKLPNMDQLVRDSLTADYSGVPAYTSNIIKQELKA